MGVGGQRHAPVALPPGKRPGTHCIGGWVGPRAGLDGFGKYHLHRESNDLLRAGRSGEQIPVEVIFSEPVQTGPGAYPASYTVGTGSLSRG